jgi:CheY-like chemotaxis protein
MKKILVVEDDKSMLDALALILRYEGYEVVTAQNGICALNVLNDHTPNLILLDMVMPEMNGWEFAEAYTKKFEQRAPIIIITGAADPIQRANDVQAAGYIEKPYEIDTLLTTVKNNISA